MASSHSTATEHATGNATEHALGLDAVANIVFINMDWKKNRMYKTLTRNMNHLANTIQGVVCNMKPTMICMCEMGETEYPLDQAQMQQVADKVISVWTGAATEHIKLRSMFTEGYPYMTIYIDGPIRCSHHRILQNLYDARGQLRTAQAFACSAPCGESLSLIHI